jgi:hypothetical protein
MLLEIFLMLTISTSYSVSNIPILPKVKLFAFQAHIVALMLILALSENI